MMLILFLASFASRLLTKSASGVLATLRGSTYGREYDSPLRLLRSCWTAFLNSLRDIRVPAVIGNEVSFLGRQIVCQQPARLSVTDLLGSLVGALLSLARIIHEHFCCNRRSAAPTSLRPAGSPLRSSTYCTSTPQILRAPCAGLTTRLGDFATNCHEECGLAAYYLMLPLWRMCDR